MENAKIFGRATLPSWSLALPGYTYKRQRIQVQVWELHYHLSHELLQDVADFLSGAEQPAVASTPSKRLYIDFVTACRSLEEHALQPSPNSVRAECRSGSLGPHQCTRQLALIELPDKTLGDLPLSHESLLKEIHARRIHEESQCRVLSELIEAAVQQLIEYSQDRARGYASWRFFQHRG